MDRAPGLDDAACYLGGMEQELTILGDLLDVARRQHAAAHPAADEALDVLVVRRHEIEERLHALERSLAPLRPVVAASPSDPVLARAVADIHAAARSRVAEILAVDRDTLDVLATAHGHRHERLQHLDAGGATLAAYRRVIAPGATRAELIDQRG